MICIIAISVVEFSREGLKINCSKIELLNFDNWSSGELSKIGHQFRKQSDLRNDVIKKCL